MGGAAVLSSTLTVTDAATMSNTLTVAEAATMSSTLAVTKEATLSDVLKVTGDVSMNAKLYVADKLKIGENSDAAVALDICANDAIMIPRGTNNQRPVATTGTGTSGDAVYKGYVRYNTETEQFEGFGAGNAWGSLGGVKDVDQDTYILAESSAGTDNDELQFYTADTERMRITKDGDLSLNTGTKLIVMSDSSMTGRLDVGGDVSMGGDLTIEGNLNVLQQQNTSVINTTVNNYEVIISNDLSVNGEVKAIGDASFGGNLFIGGTTNLEGDVSMGTSLIVNGTADIIGAVDITGATTITGDVSLNNKLYVQDDVSFNAETYVGGNLTVDESLIVGGSFQVEDMSVNGFLSVRGGIDASGASVYAESFQFGVVDQFDINVAYQANFPISNEYITFTQGFHVIGDVSMNGRTLQF